jgi:ABC-type thiamine transport system ATPase subunit
VTELQLAQASAGALLHAEWRFSAGKSVVLGDDSRALGALAAVASGSEAAERGRVLLDGASLEFSPAARRRVASLLADEALPPARTVELGVARILAARGDQRDARAVLAGFGLERWSGRRPSELDWDERRSLALSLALGHEQARAFVLYEPLATSSVPATRVHAELERAAAGGAVVLLLTTSVDNADSLGGPSVWLERGVLRGAPLAQAPAPPPPEPLAPRPENQLVGMPTSFADPTRGSNGASGAGNP